MDTIFAFIFEYWGNYGGELLTGLFWGLTGYALMLPVLLATNIYNTVRAGRYYDVNFYHRRRRADYKRSASFYAISGVSLAIAAFMTVV